MSVKQRLQRLEAQHAAPAMTWRELMELPHNPPGWAEFMQEAEQELKEQADHEHKKQATTA